MNNRHKAIAIIISIAFIGTLGMVTMNTAANTTISYNHCLSQFEIAGRKAGNMTTYNISAVIRYDNCMGLPNSETGTLYKVYNLTRMA